MNRLNFSFVLQSFRDGLLDRYEEALENYTKALAIKSDYAEALLNHGNALNELRRPAEALSSYDRAFAVRPDDAAALSNRGTALRDVEKLRVALTCYDRALMIRAEYAEALNNRGITLMALKRVEDALASYSRALTVKPDYAEAHFNIATALMEIGRVSAARHANAKAIQLAPTRIQFYFGLTRYNRFTDDDRHLRTMESFARDMQALPTEHQIYLHFALGKAYEDVGQHERSFHHLTHGNKLKRQRLAYDERGALNWLNRIQAVFTPELIIGNVGFGDPSGAPIFIVGMPRSGTTLVEQIVASHPKVFGAGELQFFAEGVTEFCRTSYLTRPFPELMSSVGTDQLRQLGANYVDAIRGVASEAEHITDKMPHNFAFIGLIHLALPRARIIHVRRSPLDVCLSCFSLLFEHEIPYAYDLMELGRYYRAYETLMKHWRKVLPKGVVFEVQYEELVTDLEKQTRKLVDYCGLEWNDACLAFHETRRSVRTASATQVRQPIYRTSVGRSRPYVGLLEPLIATLAGDCPADLIGR